jgi:hypothetical protein
VSGRLGGIHFSPVPAVKLPFCWVFDARPAIRQICRTTFPPEKRLLPFAKRFLRRKNDNSHEQNDFANGAVAGRTGK